MLPVLVQFGPVTIGTHDFFTLLGLAVGMAIYYRALRRDGLMGPEITAISLAAVSGGVVGARLLTGWEILDDIQAAGAPISAVLTHGPKSILGAFVGGWLAIALSKRALGYTVSTGDYYTLAIPVGLAIGRVGCFLSELPLGAPTSLPWGMTVSPEAAAAFARCPGCGGPIHPSMLYEIGFVVGAALLIWRRGPLLPTRGDTVRAFLLAYGLFRFGIEFLRGNEVQFAGLTGPQLVLIPFIAFLAVHFVRRVLSGAYRLPPPVPARAGG